jgi:hypothetical protein
MGILGNELSSFALEVVEEKQNKLFNAICSRYQAFKSDYRYGTDKFYNLLKGITKKSPKVHYNDNGVVWVGNINLLGTREDYNTYKTRFFVTGTKQRENKGKIKGHQSLIDDSIKMI